MANVRKWFCAYKNVVWGKIFRFSLIGDLRFDVSEKWTEDSIFINMLISKIHKYAFSQIGTYYYVQRSSNIAHNNNESVLEKLNRFFNANEIEDVYKIRPIFVYKTLEQLNWILHHKYITYLSKERIAFIQVFLNNIIDKDCILFDRRDFRSLRISKYRIKQYSKGGVFYKLVILNEKLTEFWRKCLFLPKTIAKTIYFVIKH